jgi:hypothetical protein
MENYSAIDLMQPKTTDPDDIRKRRSTDDHTEPNRDLPTTP